MKRVISILFIFWSVFSFSQYLPLTAQYMYNPLMVNPGLTGCRGDLVTSFSYRQQWLNTKYSPNTLIATGHTTLKNEHVAVGFQVIRDQVKFVNRTGGAAFLAYRLHLRDGWLGMGMKAGLNNQSIKIDEIDLIDLDDEVFLELGNAMKPSVGMGFHYETPDFYLGFALPEMVSGLSSENDLQQFNLNVMSGYHFHISPRFQIIPNFMIRKYSVGNPQLDLNFISRIDDKLDLGLIFRSPSVAGVSIDYIFANNLQIAYVFDTNIGSRKISNSFGNHEISLIFEFKTVVESTNTKFF